MPARPGRRWLEQAGCDLDVCRPYAGDELPALTSYDALLVLGGPMGANDDDAHAWLGPVKELVRDARATHLPTLGICLGHQLIAAALGGTVGPNPLGQQVGLLGWAGPTRPPGTGCRAPRHPRRGVQWNDDVVTRLPDDATLLAGRGTARCRSARFAPQMWGVQLHPEVDVPVLQPWAESDRGSHKTRGIDTDACSATSTPRGLSSTTRGGWTCWPGEAKGLALSPTCARRGGSSRSESDR